MAREIGIVEAKKKFTKLLALTASSGERFIIERRGKPIAVLIGLKDLEQLGEEMPTKLRSSQGLLEAARALGNYEDFDKIMKKIRIWRKKSKTRQVKLD